MRYRSLPWMLVTLLLAGLAGPTHAADSGAIALTPTWATGVIAEEAGRANVVVTDLNHDKKNDIVSCSQGSAYVLDKIAGAETYDTIWYSEQLGCNTITTGDRDGDGTGEIYVGTADAKILIYDGTSFARLNSINLPALPESGLPPDQGAYNPAGVQDIRVAGVDGNGRLQIVAVRYDATFVYDATTLALEWQATAKGGQRLGIGQIDDDPGLEIIVSNDPAHILDAAHHTEKWAYNGGFGSDLAVGDTDGDKIAEIAYIQIDDSSARVIVFDTRKKQARWQTDKSYEIHDVGMGDIDSDGRQEVFSERGEGIGGIACYRGRDGAVLWEHPLGGDGLAGITVGDTDNDGANELVWGSGLASSGRDLLNIADAKTGKIKWQSPDLDGPFRVAVGDVDNDQQPDIVFASKSSDSTSGAGTIRVYDARTYQLKWAIPMADGPSEITAIAVGQVDADPASEIVLLGGYSDTMVLLVYDGTSHKLEWQGATRGRGQPTGLQIIRRSHEDRDSIIVGLYSGRVLVFQGAGNVISWDSGTLDNELQDLTTGDLDGDGVLDLVVLTTKHVYIYDTATWRLKAQKPFALQDKFFFRTVHVTICRPTRHGPGQLLLSGLYQDQTSLQSWAGDDYHLLWQADLGPVGIDRLGSADVDGDGAEELVVLGRQETQTTPGQETTNQPSLISIGPPGNPPTWRYENGSYWGAINSFALVVPDAGPRQLVFGSDTLVVAERVGAGGAAPSLTAPRFFAETGRTVRGSFRQYWETHGALPLQGYPVTDEFTEISTLDGQPHTVQYFERAVFEAHPELAPPYNVLLTQLGTYRYHRLYPQGAPGQQRNPNNPRTFAETGHTVGGSFRTYWESHGGLEQLGYPISEEFAEQSALDNQIYTVQYFERVVLEWHPANQPPYNVLGSQLGFYEFQIRYPSGVPGVP